MEALVAATELAPLEEHVGKAVYWPPWLRELALKDWLDLPERFKLTVHLLGNVAPPFVVAKHVAPRLRDSKACAHVDRHSDVVAGALRSPLAMPRTIGGEAEAGVEEEGLALSATGHSSTSYHSSSSPVRGSGRTCVSTERPT